MARPTDMGGADSTRRRRRPPVSRKPTDGEAQAGDGARPGVQEAQRKAAEGVQQAKQKATEGAAQAAETAAQAAETAVAGVVEARRTAAAQTLPREVAVERGRGPLVGLAIGGGLGFVAIFAIVRLGLSGRFDVLVTRALQRVRLPGFDALMRAVSWPGFPPQSRTIPPLVSGAMAVLGYPLEAAFQALAWGTGLVSTLTKTLMKRPRPTEPEVRVVTAPLGGSSFPSGHVITYMGVYGFLAYLAHTLIRPAALRRALVGFFGGLVALVGPSRIYQGHHWPTDVIASYLLGLSYLIGVTSLYRRLKGRLAPRLAEPAGSVRAQIDSLAAAREERAATGAGAGAGASSKAAREESGRSSRP